MSTLLAVEPSIGKRPRSVESLSSSMTSTTLNDWMNAAKSMAETGMQLHKLCQTAEGAEGAKAVREMLATAKAAGVAEALLAIGLDGADESFKRQRSATRRAPPLDAGASGLASVRHSDGHLYMWPSAAGVWDEALWCSD